MQGVSSRSLSRRKILLRDLIFTCFVFSNNGTTNEDVRGKSWYFGPISRADCDVLMAEKGQDGDFLVRDSESTVSFFCSENVWHHN